jgi:hypothetical protein
MLTMGTSFVKRFRRLWDAGTLRLALDGEAGALLARLGDWLHAPSLTYNPWTSAIFHRAAVEIAPTLARRMRPGRMITQKARTLMVIIRREGSLLI